MPFARPDAVLNIEPNGVPRPSNTFDVEVVEQLPEVVVHEEAPPPYSHSAPRTDSHWRRRRNR